MTIRLRLIYHVASLALIGDGKFFPMITTLQSDLVQKRPRGLALAPGMLGLFIESV